MARRLFDLTIAFTGLVIASPVILVSGCLVKLLSKGPVFYRAVRSGRNGVEFVMYKIRTMHSRQSDKSRVKVTAEGDPRIFRVGGLIRKLKLDELPQLWNVLKGDMSLVGPRPEDPAIVMGYYRGWQLETLAVRPGIVSPGAIFNYTHGDDYIDPSNPERSYVREFMPRKLALDLVYVRHASLLYDMRVIGRTMLMMVLMIVGKRVLPLPPEVKEASSISGLRY